VDGPTADEMGPPRCPDCGFDAAQWTDGDTVTTARALEALIAPYRSGLPAIDEPLADLAARIPAARAEAAGGRISGPTLHPFQHELHQAGRARHTRGLGPPTATGSVAQLNVGRGGVPKQPVDAVEITWSGLVGDRQRTRQHHGRPFQAVCLWSSDVIEALQAEGHPIAPGSAGENVTVRGLDWSSLVPGVVVDIGGARVEISSYAIPCTQNRRWFADGDFNRILHDRHPGSSRLYAYVLRPGPVRQGDPVVVEPDR